VLFIQIQITARLSDKDAVYCGYHSYGNCHYFVHYTFLWLATNGITRRHVKSFYFLAS